MYTQTVGQGERNIRESSANLKMESDGHTDPDYQTLLGNAVTNGMK